MIRQQELAFACQQHLDELCELIDSASNSVTEGNAIDSWKIAAYSVQMQKRVPEMAEIITNIAVLLTRLQQSNPVLFDFDNESDQIVNAFFDGSLLQDLHNAKYLQVKNTAKALEKIVAGWHC